MQPERLDKRLFRPPKNRLVSSVALAGLAALFAACGAKGDKEPEFTATTEPTVSSRVTPEEILLEATETVDPLVIKGAEIGKAAPDVTLTSTGGQEFKLSSILGKKPVVISLHTIFSEYPDLDLGEVIKLKDKFKDSIEVIPIAFVSNFHEEYDYFPLYIANEDFYKKFGRLSPQSYFIDSSGIFQFRRQYVDENSLEMLTKTLLNSTFPIDPSYSQSLLPYEIDESVNKPEILNMSLDFFVSADEYAISDEDAAFINSMFSSVDSARLAWNDDPRVYMDIFNSASRRLLEAYCRNPNEDTLRLIRLFASIMYFTVQREIERGRLEPSTWQYMRWNYDTSCQGNIVLD